MAVSRVLQPPSPIKGKVSCDDAEPRIQEVKVVQATASGIENQAPVPLESYSDATKKGVSLTFNFQFLTFPKTELMLCCVGVVATCMFVFFLLLHVLE